MPTVSFTQYHNELARVLGTHQRQNKGVSSKAILATQEGTESEGEEKSGSKSQRKRDRKISTQSSQIRDLRKKLNGAIAENTQIREWSNPEMLQTAFTNALQASGQFHTGGRFFGKKREPKVAAGIDGTMDPDKSWQLLQRHGSREE